MHNPFVLFDRRILEHQVKSGHRYYVRQTYPRGVNHSDTCQKAAFLITHYTDQSHAKIHLAALTKDANAFLYDISNAEHYKKLEIAAEQPAGYKIFAPILAQKQWRPSEQMRGKIKRYIDDKLHWKPERQSTVNSDLFLQFGTLFITLKFGTHEAKIPLSEIEKN